MLEGFWINYSTGKSIMMPEHETWMRDFKNAKKLGVPESIHSQAATIKNREAYLTFLMSHLPLMRVRGHGQSVTFEYASHDRHDAMDAIWLWGKENAGPFTGMMISNLATHETTQMSFQQFEDEMNSGGSEAVMRVAKATIKFNKNLKIAKELLSISKEILVKPSTVEG